MAVLDFEALRDAIHEAEFWLASASKGEQPGNYPLPECSDGLKAALTAASSLNLLAIDEAVRATTETPPGAWAARLLMLLETALRLAPAVYSCPEEQAPIAAYIVNQLHEREQLLWAVAKVGIATETPQENTETAPSQFETRGKYFCHLHADGMGDAKIRTHWQGMTDTQRKAICPKDWGKFHTSKLKGGVEQVRALTSVVKQCRLRASSKVASAPPTKKAKQRT